MSQLDLKEAVLALRARLSTLEVLTTGATTLGASGNTYTRETGSFVTDGFWVGMEVTPVNFPDDSVSIVTDVQDLTLVVDRALVPAPNTTGRELKVTLPSKQGYENTKIEPEDNEWYLEEDFIPGQTNTIGVGQLSEVEQDPMYILRIGGIPGIGITALYAVVNAILALFPAQYAMVLPSGRSLRVRGRPAPYASQILPSETGHSVVSITIPVRARTQNLV